MRSGRLAAAAAAAVAVAGLTAACGAPAGVAGVSTLPPVPRTEEPPTTSPDGAVAATSGGSVVGDGDHMRSVAPPPAPDPVRLPPPKVSEYTYAFPVKGCRVSYARQLLVLPKSTIWAGKGCAFVSPVDGVVREVNVQNRWVPSTDRGQDREGRFVTVLGEDGVLYLGGHLDSVEPQVRPGAKVKAGQRLGSLGNSGNARDTASNLYFAISWPVPQEYWWIRRGMIEPWDYLDAWYDGNRTLSPKKAVFAMRKRVGRLPSCDRLCTSKQPPAAKGGGADKGGKTRTSVRQEPDEEATVVTPG
ncbi:M23 family metallopeptidase [Microtetraspora niveoalba]|uniref:M23 family metallopeptidase n=1 Tax=Microtetraspora niveoalba TaxID=46175 RepID=UPI00082FD3E0|nr:M23 family metallopeptidase [Microtetraspora niveoalba]